MRNQQTIEEISFSPLLYHAARFPREEADVGKFSTRSGTQFLWFAKAVRYLALARVCGLFPFFRFSRERARAHWLCISRGVEFRYFVL